MDTSDENYNYKYMEEMRETIRRALKDLNPEIRGLGNLTYGIWSITFFIAAVGFFRLHAQFSCGFVALEVFTGGISLNPDGLVYTDALSRVHTRFRFLTEKRRSAHNNERHFISRSR